MNSYQRSERANELRKAGYIKVFGKVGSENYIQYISAVTEPITVLTESDRASVPQGQVIKGIGEIQTILETKKYIKKLIRALATK